MIVNTIYLLGDELPELAVSQLNGNGNGGDNGNGKGNEYRSGNGHSNGFRNGSQKMRSPTKLVTLTLPKNARKDLLMQIKTCIVGFPGDVGVRLLIPQNGSYHEVNIKTKITPISACLNQLRKLVGGKNVHNL